MAEGSDDEMERTLQNYRTAGREALGCEQSQHVGEMLEWGSDVQSTPGESEGKQSNTQNKNRKRKRAPVTRSRRQMNREKQDMMRRLEEKFANENTREGRGEASAVQELEDGEEVSEVCRRGKGKGHGGKREPGDEGENGGKDIAA